MRPSVWSLWRASSSEPSVDLGEVAPVYTGPQDVPARVFPTDSARGMYSTGIEDESPYAGEVIRESVSVGDIISDGALHLAITSAMPCGSGTAIKAKKSDVVP